MLTNVFHLLLCTEMSKMSECLNVEKSVIKSITSLITKYVRVRIRGDTIGT